MVASSKSTTFVLVVTGKFSKESVVKKRMGIAPIQQHYSEITSVC